ncbi:WYL domain-containing protein [Micromonospora echinaurantiaca]|uniref:WYL domain-containing protein n=1 Tax=Micromonospora echinaurantiaca TaxID=47857 RepID=UPI0015609B0E|nr:WYL domain-containing protein [Micromonospora echinaurantiaca]
MRCGDPPSRWTSRRVRARTPSLGLEVDRRGRLFVAGGTAGDARVVDTRTGEVLARYQFATVRATVTVHQPAAVVAERLWPGMGAVEPVDAGSCLVHLGAETAADLAWMVAVIGVDFTVTEPPELVEAVRALGERCRRALAPPADRSG